METSANRLAELLRYYGITAAELAERTGIPKSSISMWLSGKRTMRQDKIGIISDCFGVDPGWLMGYDVPMKRKKEDTSTDGVQKNVQAEVYYLDDEAREMAEFLMKNPEYKVLFSGCRKVSPKDISFVKEFIDRVTKEE